LWAFVQAAHKGSLTLDVQYCAPVRKVSEPSAHGTQQEELLWNILAIYLFLEILFQIWFLKYYISPYNQQGQK
jgi:hypothetical protein